jgi:aspartokinase-like uncharacterized kinase
VLLVVHEGGRVTAFQADFDVSGTSKRQGNGGWVLAGAVVVAGGWVLAGAVKKHQSRVSLQTPIC